MQFVLQKSEISGLTFTGDLTVNSAFQVQGGIEMGTIPSLSGKLPYPMPPCIIIPKIIMEFQTNFREVRKFHFFVVNCGFA